MWLTANPARVATGFADRADRADRAGCFAQALLYVHPAEDPRSIDGVASKVEIVVFVAAVRVGCRNGQVSIPGRRQPRRLEWCLRSGRAVGVKSSLRCSRPWILKSSVPTRHCQHFGIPFGAALQHHQAKLPSLRPSSSRPSSGSASDDRW